MRPPSTPSAPSGPPPATAEYAVGTLGAATCAAVLVHLGADGWFFDQLREVFARALDPTTLVEHLRRGRPWTPIR
ncbi:MAG: DUF4244 domain-containing protein [Actinomycetales bacterium]|nr:MAG: DUF4244 domain-containing protein [Actinomycetales bacterium]